MNESNKSVSIFKSYLLKAAAYKGGKAVSEIKSRQGKNI